MYFDAITVLYYVFMLIKRERKERMIVILTKSKNEARLAVKIKLGLNFISQHSVTIINTIVKLEL